MFSAIPLLFGLQQFSEGFVWLSLTGLGCALSAFRLIGLLFFFEPAALISGHHIRYDFQSCVHKPQYTGFL